MIVYLTTIVFVLYHSIDKYSRFAMMNSKHWIGCLVGIAAHIIMCAASDDSGKSNCFKIPIS